MFLLLAPDRRAKDRSAPAGITAGAAVLGAPVTVQIAVFGVPNAVLFVLVRDANKVWFVPTDLAAFATGLVQAVRGKAAESALDAPSKA